MSNNSTLQSISDNISHAIKSGVIHLKTKKTKTSTHSIIDGRDVTNFSSYSYLGLERNQKLILACAKSAEEYGTQFGFSRAYISIDLYGCLEKELSKIFGNPTIVAPSTTLAHQSALPVLIGDNDLIIIDQYAHTSIHTSVNMLKGRGISVQIIRHNDMDELEKRIKNFQRKDSKIWYLCDGVYSMHGDFAPVKKLETLMDEYNNFSVYIDDAHGMSWCGQNGQGFVLSHIGLHNQMVIVTSLNKAFAGAGGAIILPKKETMTQIKNCGNTMIFSTPIQPPLLGAGIASCLLHQTKELTKLQSRLNRNIHHCIEKIKELGLVELSRSYSPIFFIPCCLPKVSYSISKRMLSEGYYLTPTAYPAVSPRKSGIRFCISAEHSPEQINLMLESLARNYSAVLAEENVSMDLISKSFKIKIDTLKKHPQKEIQSALKVEKFRTIKSINENEWNRLFDNGVFDVKSLSMFESTFTENEKMEDNWEFHYFIIRDQADNIILATYFTICLLKEDIFKEPDISRRIEIKRKFDNYYLCDKSLLMGTPITEGRHFFLDKQHSAWKESVVMLLEAINELQHQNKTNSIFLRDFEKTTSELSDVFIENGYVKTQLPDFSHTLNLTYNHTIDDFLLSLPASKRRKIVYEAKRHEVKFRVQTFSKIELQELKRGYELYLNVQKRSMAINSFPLPFSFFKDVNENEDWEFIMLYLDDNEYPNETGKLVGIVICHKLINTYTPLYMGLDYKYKYSHNIYKQVIWQIVKRPIELNMTVVNLGLTASLHKTRYGAKAVRKEVFIQMQDTFNQGLLEIEYAAEMAD